MLTYSMIIAYYEGDYQMSFFFKYLVNRLIRLQNKSTKVNVIVEIVQSFKEQASEQVRLDSNIFDNV